MGKFRKNLDKMQKDLDLILLAIKVEEKNLKELSYTNEIMLKINEINEFKDDKKYKIDEMDYYNQNAFTIKSIIIYSVAFSIFATLQQYSYGETDILKMIINVLSLTIGFFGFVFSAFSSTKTFKFSNKYSVNMKKYNKYR